MSENYKQTSITDVVEALDALKNIERPDGDNEGDPINSQSVYGHLSPEQQELVDNAERVASDYLRKQGDEGKEPNNRAITELKKHGYEASLNADQYEHDRLVGHVKVDGWVVDINDPSPESNGD